MRDKQGLMISRRLFLVKSTAVGAGLTLGMFLPGGGRAEPAASLPAGAGPGKARITSYNVCYTKLLRAAVLQRAATAGANAGEPLGIAVADRATDVAWLREHAHGGNDMQGITGPEEAVQCLLAGSKGAIQRHRVHLPPDRRGMHFLVGQVDVVV